VPVDLVIRAFACKAW